jgi:hypothetical protein
MTDEEQLAAESAKTAMSGCMGIIVIRALVAAFVVGISNTPSPLHRLHTEVCATAAVEGNPCPFTV